MGRRGEHIGDPPLFDDFAAVHYAHPLGHFADDAEIMGDQQQRHAHARLQVLQEVQNLRLDGHVEGGRGFVGNQQVRLVGERHGDHHPLLLAAGERVRQVVQPALRFAQPDQMQELHHPFASARRAHLLVYQQHLGDLLFDRVQRVERRQRLLEDDGDAIATKLAHPFGGRRQHLLVAEADRPRRMPGERIRQQPHDAERGDRLAGAALADQADRLRLRDVERGAANSVHLPLPAAEGYGEVSDAKQRGVGHVGHSAG